MPQFFDRYELQQTIGTGAFSEVKLGIDRTNGAKYAIKIIDRAKCKGKENMIETEVNILKRVRHPNIIQLYEMHEFGGKIYLVMELVTGGELFDEIVGRGKYTERDAARIVQRILCAIDYLHVMGIVHRDLKPENLLLSDKSKHAKIMISDFGLSKIFNDVEVMKTACGTPGYVAPEVLKRQGYGKEVDLWSLGVITYILLCGYPPFFDPNNVELFKKIMAGRYEFDSPWWDNISDKAKDFIRRMLVLDPRQRFTAAMALGHPFVVDHCGYIEPLSLQANAAEMASAAANLAGFSAMPGAGHPNGVPVQQIAQPVPMYASQQQHQQQQHQQQQQQYQQQHQKQQQQQQGPTSMQGVMPTATSPMSMAPNVSPNGMQHIQMPTQQQGQYAMSMATQRAVVGPSNLAPVIQANMQRAHSSKALKVDMNGNVIVMTGVGINPASNSSARSSTKGPEPRPLSAKSPLDDSGIVTSNEGIAGNNGNSNHQNYKHDVNGYQQQQHHHGKDGNPGSSKTTIASKIHRLTSWFRSGAVNPATTPKPNTGKHTHAGIHTSASQNPYVSGGLHHSIESNKNY